jgi:hypothetical protein
VTPNSGVDPEGTARRRGQTVETAPGARAGLGQARRAVAFAQTGGALSPTGLSIRQPRPCERVPVCTATDHAFALKLTTPAIRGGLVRSVATRVPN